MSIERLRREKRARPYTIRGGKIVEKTEPEPVRKQRKKRTPKAEAPVEPVEGGVEE